MAISDLLLQYAQQPSPLGAALKAFPESFDTYQKSKDIIKRREYNRKALENIQSLVDAGQLPKEALPFINPEFPAESHQLSQAISPFLTLHKPPRPPGGGASAAGLPLAKLKALQGTLQFQISRFPKSGSIEESIAESQTPGTTQVRDSLIDNLDNVNMEIAKLSGSAAVKAISNPVVPTAPIGKKIKFQMISGEHKGRTGTVDAKDFDAKTMRKL